MTILIKGLIISTVLLTSACTTRYSANHPGHHSNVSVGVHGDIRTSSAVGALIVGGLIGHLISEAAHQNEAQGTTRVNQSPQSVSPVKAETNSEQNRFYQLGQDGNCYLMEKSGDSVKVISAVPKYSCQ